MKALILAAGYGTRLYPYTKNYPKPLLKVNNRPIIAYLLDKLERLDNLSEILIVTNDRFYKYFERYRQTLKIKNRIKIINDCTRTAEEKLGAIRDMELVFREEGFGEDFLVLGGDNFFKEPLEEFIHFARKISPALTIGVFDLKDKTQAKHYGVVSLNQKKRLTEFYEKPDFPKSALVAMCLYYFPKNKLQLINEYLINPKHFSDAIGAYIRWLVKNDEVYGFLFDKLWFDIGHTHTFERLKEILK
ncbi:MAG: nucleotidyltransferase family protein [Candidatus Omnitrophota bacterium]